MSDTRSTPFISVRQALDRLNGSIGKTLLYELVARGELRSTRLGGKVLIDEGHLDELLAANLRGPAPSPSPAAGPQAPQGAPAPPPHPVGAKAGGRPGRRKIKLW